MKRTTKKRKTYPIDNIKIIIMGYDTKRDRAVIIGLTIIFMVIGGLIIIAPWVWLDNIPLPLKIIISFFFGPCVMASPFLRHSA